MVVDSSLASRLKIAIPVIIGLVGIIFFFPATTKFVIALVLLRSLWEFFIVFRLTAPAFRAFTWPALIYSGLFLIQASHAEAPTPTPLAFLGIFGVFAIQLFFPRSTQGTARIAITITGFMYIIWLGAHSFYLYNLGDQNQGCLLLFSIFFICKFSDATAYFAGKKYGKRKLIPRVSPNKTIEGLIGAYAGGLCGIPFLLSLAGFHLGHAIIFCILLVTVASLGDLFESQFKRELGVKDTANDIPGFGGSLDMIDSVLWCVPTAYWYIATQGLLNA
jgi:phosphatidate cytidylyltransferase